MRAYIYPTIRALKPTVALDCERVTKARATIPAHVNLQNVKPGMIFRLARGRQADFGSTQVIAKVERGAIFFETERSETKATTTRGEA